MKKYISVTLFTNCRTVENLWTNSMSSTTTLTSQYSIQIEYLPNFGSLFSGCSIGNVNVNLKKQQ